MFHAILDGTFMEINSVKGKKLRRANQNSKFLWDSFSNTENVSATIEFRTERQSDQW